MWRFWRALPPKGKTGVFFGSWYTEPIVDRVYRRIGERRADAHARPRSSRFERMLVDEGALVVKLWLHLSKKAQTQALREARVRPGDGLARDPAGLEATTSATTASAR